MRIPRWLAVVLIVLAAGLGYALAIAGRSTSAPQPSADSATEVLLDWLNASPSQRAELRAHDPTFAQDLEKLRSELSARRAELAASLENTQTPNDVIRKSSEEVIAASAAVERRVVGYLLSVRDHLSAAQQRQLFGVCAETVRQHTGNQWRHGQRGGPWRGGPGRQRGRGEGGGAGRRGPPASRPGL